MGTYNATRSPSHTLRVQGLGSRVCAAQGIRLRAEGLDLVFYGDSITESLRGTQMGIPIDKFKGIPEVAAAHFSHLNWAAFSLAGPLLSAHHSLPHRCVELPLRERASVVRAVSCLSNHAFIVLRTPDNTLWVLSS